jgi:iron complex transport system substrate-binding protein
MRILSLLPSATEIVCALGAESELVGRSEECDYPARVQRLPILMRARRLDADRPSGEIDRRVRAMRDAGQSLYELDLDGLKVARPDVLLTQDLCGVCSVTEREVAEACRTVGVSPHVLSLSPRSLTEVRESIRSIGEAIGRPEEARRLVEGLARLEAGTPRPGRPDRAAPRVAVVEWVDPPILAGLWTPEIIRRAGGIPVGPEPGTPSARSDWAALANERPDLVIVSPCSFAVTRTRSETAVPSVAQGLRRLGPSAGVWLADEAYFSRPGPRLWDGIDLVGRLLNGDARTLPMPVERWG